MANRLLDRFQARLESQQERLQAELFLAPYLSIVSFAIILVIGSYVFDLVDSRQAHATNPIQLEAEGEKEGAIWLGVALSGENLNVFTDEGRKFSIPRKVQSYEDLRELVEFLENKVKRKIRQATLARDISSSEITAVISVDEKLRYAHIRPVLSALASARITNYGFETISERALSKSAVEHHKG